MKKNIPVVLPLIAILGLFACSKGTDICAMDNCYNKSVRGSIYCEDHRNEVLKNNHAPSKATNFVEETTTEATTMPVVSYSDVQSGAYNDGYVRIEAIVDSVEKDDILSSLDVSVWINNAETYVKKDLTFITSDYLGEENFNSVYNNIKQGDTCLLTCKVYSDGSFGITDNCNIEIIGSGVSLEDIRQTYKNHCQSISAASLARTPEQYAKKVDVVLSGKVFQIVDENDKDVQFLLDTGGENGIVNVYYDRPEGTARILENDNITVYGNFTHMLDYKSVLGSNKSVPSIVCNVLN